MAEFKFKPMSIKGKSYIPVAERIRYLAEEVKDYSLVSTYEYIADRKMWIVKSELTIWKNLGTEKASHQTYTGLAQEIESEEYKDVNFSSALENAHTSAIGRACGAAGIGLTDSLASVEEMVKAANRQSGKNPHWNYAGKQKGTGADMVSGTYNGRTWFARVDENGDRVYYKEKPDWLNDMETGELTPDPLPELR